MKQHAVQTYTQHRENNNRLLAILQSYAPNAQAQTVCAQLQWDAEKQGAKPQDITEMFTVSILDGLRYGNWPWVPAQPLTH